MLYICTRQSDRLTFDCTITQMEDIGRNCADREVPSDGLSLYWIPYTQRQAKQFDLLPCFLQYEDQY